MVIQQNHETILAVKEFDAVILFMTKREPNHQILSETIKIRDMALRVITDFETLGTLSAWPYWKPPSTRREDKLEMTQLFRELVAMTNREEELTITANTMLQGLHRHGLHDFCSPTLRLINQTTFTEMACCEIDRMNKKNHEAQAMNPTPTTSTTKPQSCPSSAGDDT